MIATRGLPTEAYFSSFGPDEANDPSIIGDYLLTDDGLLNGTDFSTLIVSLENPVDSVSGVILDIDSDESFIVNALDENDNVLMTQVIEAGDELTGDGIATPWGFNLDGCEGSIYTITFDGTRSSGDFGLGMDNFVFCFSGIDLIEDLDVNVTDILCQDNPGAIAITSNNPDLMYSIDDGENFNDTGLFENLSLGEYEIIVQDPSGCIAILNEEVAADGPTVIEELIINHTSCGLENGSFEVFATQDQGVIYFIDAFSFQSQNSFEDLPAGNYTITVIGPSGCSASQEFEILDSEPLFLEDPVLEDDACQKTIGSIEVNTNGGTGDLSYSLNDGAFQSSPFFDSLVMGQYTLEIQDERFCTLLDTVQINDTPGIAIDEIQTTETICDLPIGTIALSASGGTGALNYQLENGDLNSIAFFEFLSEGEYNLTVVDELGCRQDTVARIDIPICPLYIPNVFTPEVEGENNEFRIYARESQEVAIISYQLYDRWGSRIYSASNFGIYDNGFWWTGNDDSYEYSSGVYVYRIEVEYFDGSQEVLVGDITLVR